MESTPVISSAPRPDCWRIAPTKSSEMIPLEALIVRIVGAAAVWPFGSQVKATRWATVR